MKTPCGNARTQGVRKNRSHAERENESKNGRGGFSLLEVILALAILTGALAALGEVARLALRNAESARDLTQAQLLGESKLAEITSGITPPDPVERAEFDTSGQSVDGEIPFLYSIRLEDTDEEGLRVVRVVVMQKPELKEIFFIDRWILDDGTELSEETAGEQTAP